MNKSVLKPRNSESVPDTFAARMRDTMCRLTLDDARMAAYLGVPVFTLRKWATGERQPSAAATRLMDVLGLVEAVAPAVHAGFLPPVSDTPRKRSRLKNSV